MFLTISTDSIILKFAKEKVKEGPAWRTEMVKLGEKETVPEGFFGEGSETFASSSQMNLVFREHTQSNYFKRSKNHTDFIKTNLQRVSGKRDAGACLTLKPSELRSG